jgi:hypothetical protein
MVLPPLELFSLRKELPCCRAALSVFGGSLKLLRPLTVSLMQRGPRLTVGLFGLERKLALASACWARLGARGATLVLGARQALSVAAAVLGETEVPAVSGATEVQRAVAESGGTEASTAPAGLSEIEVQKVIVVSGGTEVHKRTEALGEIGARSRSSGLDETDTGDSLHPCLLVVTAKERLAGQMSSSCCALLRSPLP